ncbi:MAG: biotin--[Oscillospiraceae bacterium]|nr:biotin--[acetyl-CoA-carboxylase] ligase [Oscillospiraceae bacterium]
MKEQILSQFTTECPWRDTLYWYDTIDSTNTRAKALAKEGAPAGTVLIAGNQTGGRGRLGRSFSSPAGMGVYLSVILRPGCKGNQLMHLTCATAVAACEAAEKASGIVPGIKWINDLVCGKEKLGGILTEMSVNSDGFVDWAVVGIGINCCQKKTDFPTELQNMATSLLLQTGKACHPALLAACLTESLYEMDKILLSQKQQLMDIYRRHCVTLGKQILMVRGEESAYGEALDLDEDGGLLVRFSDGTEKVVSSGEVSIRGMYGYV